MVRKGLEKRNDWSLEKEVVTRHGNEFAEFISGSMRPEPNGLQRQHGSAIAPRANCISKFKYRNVKNGDARKTIAWRGQRDAHLFECQPGRSGKLLVPTGHLDD